MELRRAANARELQGSGTRAGKVVAGGGDGAHEGEEAVGGEMVLDGPGGEGAVAADVGVEEAGQEAGRIDRIDAKLGVVAEIVDGGRAGRLADPLAVGAIDEAGGSPRRGDGQGPAGGIVDQAAGRQGTGPVGIVGESVAGRVIGNRAAADRGGSMGAARTQALAGGGAIAVGIDEVGVGGAQAGVEDQVVGAVIGVVGLFSIGKCCQDGCTDVIRINAADPHFLFNALGTAAHVSTWRNRQLRCANFAKYTDQLRILVKCAPRAQLCFAQNHGNRWRRAAVIVVNIVLASFEHGENLQPNVARIAWQGSGQ